MKGSSTQRSHQSWNVIRSDTRNKDFLLLVNKLNQELEERDGDDHAFYDQFNKVDQLSWTVLAYEDRKPIGCGALKPIEQPNKAAEIKRMYVLPEYRGKGVASALLDELERWSTELGYSHAVLETGKRQPEAIAFYKKLGYRNITNYGQYEGVENSVCFKKDLL